MDEFEDLQRETQSGRSERFEPWDGTAGEAFAAPVVQPDLERVMDIPVRVSLEVGSATLSVRELLALNQGAVVELDRLAGEPLDVLVNGSLIAKGEVVVVDEQLGIRLTELVSAKARVQSLGDDA